MATHRNVLFSYNLTIKHAVINFDIDKTFLKINQSVILNVNLRK